MSEIKTTIENFYINRSDFLSSGFRGFTIGDKKTLHSYVTRHRGTYYAYPLKGSETGYKYTVLKSTDEVTIHY